MSNRGLPHATDFIGPSSNATDKYRSRNPLTRTLLARFLREIDAAVGVARPTSILDVGCGEGIVTQRLASRTGASTIGVDLGDEAQQNEWSRREGPLVSFRAASAYDLPFADASFDCVCALEVLEHLERPRDALVEMLRVARGTLLLSVPREPLWRVVHVFAGRDVRDFGNTPGHINHWSSRSFQQLVSEFGYVARVRQPFPWTVLLVDPHMTGPASSPWAPPHGRRGGIRGRASRLRDDRRPALRTRERTPAQGAAQQVSDRSDELVRVLYFGTYERDYSRNAQVISCLRAAGVEVLERHVSVWEGQRHKFAPGVRSLGRAVSAEARLALASAGEADILVVGYPGHVDMAAAKRVARGRPVVFNPLVSLEETMIDDRGLVRSRSAAAAAIRLVDRRAFRRADLVVADTEAHARYFVEQFDLPTERVTVCYVGAEDRLFRPGPREAREFRALFVGKLIPLHGLETILAAAALCPEIEFHVVGSGQLDDLLSSRPANVRSVTWVAYESLPELYRSAGCALGIFGTSEKAARVIPNKAFQALATATPLITADTPASRELLRHEVDALLVPQGDPRALASAVRRLAASPDLAQEIGSSGRTTYETQASEDVLGQRWRALLEQLIR